MGKNDQGEGFKRFEFRAGFNEFAWRGMSTNGDPGSNAPNRPRMLVNARLEQGTIIERAGLAAFDTVALHSSSACIRLQADFQLSTPKKLWMCTDGCPGISSGTGFSLNHLDQEQSPEYQRAVYASAATGSMVMGNFGGNLHLGVDESLKRVVLIPVPYGIENLALSGSSQDIVVASFGATESPPGYVIRCLQEFDGKLFVGLDAGAGLSKIVTWDGVAVRDDLTGINVPTSFGLYRVLNGGDALTVGFATATNHIRYRSTGASPGTWTTVTPSAGTVAAYSQVSYKDVLYIADRDANVWRWEGVTLQIARTPAGAIRMNAVTVFNGFLYYTYDTATAVIVGKYDGTTWTDIEKNLTTQFTLATRVNAMAPYRGSLVAAGARSGNGRLWISPGLVTTGTWVELIPSGSFSGFANSMLVA